VTRASVVVLVVVEQETAHRWVVRRSGLLAGCSSSTVPNSAGWGIHDSHERALQDWLGTADFDRPEDYWPRQWANAYVDFAAVEKRAWFTPE
jgi:predicted oxidoreductase